MRILIDMNLSPRWVSVFQGAGHEAVHWSEQGDPRAEDWVLMAWARKHGQLLFTHDLDFPALLSTTQAHSPSVLLLRDQHVLPEDGAKWVLGAIEAHTSALEAGAILSIEPGATRIRILPVQRG